PFFPSLALQRDPPQSRQELVYIGTTRGNLASRDLTSFAIDPQRAPSTGYSTVRRSFAALPSDEHALRAVPRNGSTAGLLKRPEAPWVCWRLLTLETRMGLCRRNRLRGSRRRVATRARRRPQRCGW